VLAVTVERDGTVYLDNVPVPPEELTLALQSKAEGEANPGVLLFADRDVAYQDLFRVLDRIRRAGLERVSLQAEVTE
jgi:biopolymer transport protein ExbD